MQSLIHSCPNLGGPIHYASQKDSIIMGSIFEPYTFGHLALENRFVRSATGESRAGSDGVLKEEIFPLK